MADIALSLALVALVLAVLCAFIMQRLISSLREDAIRDYNNALTQDQERDAYTKARKYGLSASYGEANDE